MIRGIVWSVLFVGMFNGFSIGTVIRLPPVLGLLWVLTLGGAFFWWQFRRDRRWPERKNRMRLRSPGVPFHEVLLSSVATLLLLLGFAGLIEFFAPSGAMSELGFWEPVLRYQATWQGWLAIALLTVGLTPVVEEFYFRGRIQHALQDRYSPPLAIVITACLFMVLHVGVPHWSMLLLSLTMGLMAGIAVVLFNSIWPAVIIHVAWNGLMTVLTELHADATAVFGPMDAELALPLAALMIVLGCSGWYRLLHSGRVAALFTPGAGTQSRISEV